MKESEMLVQGFDHFVVPVNDIVVGERYHTPSADTKFERWVRHRYRMSKVKTRPRCTTPWAKLVGQIAQAYGK